MKSISAERSNKVSLSAFAITVAMLVASKGCSSPDSNDDAATSTTNVSSVSVTHASSHVATSSSDSASSSASSASGVLVSDDDDVSDAEVQMAIAPDGTIAVAWIAWASTGVTIGYRFSIDGGQTFVAAGTVDLPDQLTGSDPALAVDANGAFYLSLLGVTAVPTTRVFVSISQPGAMSFGSPVEVSDPSAPTLFRDHPKIIVTKEGTIIVGFLENASIDSPFSSGVFAMNKVGSMGAWTRSTIAPPATFVNLFSFCEDDAGTVYTTLFEATDEAQISLRSSVDQGVTWSDASTAVSLPVERPVGLDSTCAASGSDVWVAYGTSTGAPPTSEDVSDPATSIEVAHSGDGGETFDAVRSDAFDHAAGSLALHPLLLRKQSGQLVVAYISGVADMDPIGSVRVAETNGSSFAASVTVAAPLLFDLDRASPIWLGDYMGAALTATGVDVVYPLNENGGTRIFFGTAP